jgi:hypothetical protein
MGRQGQCNITGPTREGPKGIPARIVFNGQRFVLSGTWPGLGGTQSLILGKDNVEAIIERHAGNITSGFLHLTNVLVIGENPRQKKVLNAHERGLPIVELDQLTSIIINKDKTILDLHSALYPEAMTAILTQHNIQVKRSPPTSDPTEQQRVAGNSMDKDVPGKDKGTGVGHSNGQQNNTCPRGNTWWHASQKSYCCMGGEVSVNFTVVFV